MTLYFLYANLCTHTLRTPPNANTKFEYRTLMPQESNAHSYHTSPLFKVSTNPPTPSLGKQLTKKRITQRDLLNAPHVRVIHKIRINIKENRHINRLARIQPLLLKAKTLNLAKIRRHLSRSNTIRRYADDILVTLIRRRVER